MNIPVKKNLIQEESDDILDEDKIKIIKNNSIQNIIDNKDSEDKKNK